MQNRYGYLRKIEHLCRKATGDELAHYTDAIEMDTIRAIEQYFIAPIQTSSPSKERQEAAKKFMNEYEDMKGKSIDNFSEYQLDNIITMMEEM